MAQRSSPDYILSVPGYTFIEMLHEGNRSAVYRAVVDESHQCQVIIKLLRADFPNLSELVQFRNQYTITHNLPISGIVRPLALEPWHNSYALILEDFGGISLGKYGREHKLAWQETLAIALQLADILHDLCKHRVIHKDIKPANILIHPETKQVKLIDFGIASLLPRECQELQSLGELEGTLAYLAPEQTGRMNRGIDYRVDFYALGVTLYELLTQQLPFESQDPMELIHCHMAKIPVLPHEVNAHIPAPVSEIVLKLMAKNAEDRYQSALGLKHDLQRCLSQWENESQISPFGLGEKDVSDRFLIPEMLYGREIEVETLLDKFNRVAQGSSELLLFAGFSGIGKTAVIKEVYKPITQQNGYFIQGKFDQFNRHIPFSAFVQALRNLVGQLLSASNAELQDWKQKILTALGENAQVIIDLIPELEMVLGPQPKIPELTGTAAQNRFNLWFSKFIEIFIRPEHPLVIFLDDLQWADAASLNLLKHLLEQDAGYLLLLGAYRDNEVSGGHPLMLMLDEIKKQVSAIQILTLKPLEEGDIHHLVADSLHCSVEASVSLSQLIYQKAGGNPFFTTQFLQGLQADGWITFNANTGHWQCDLSQIRPLALTGDVVEFMVQRLRLLPQMTQTLLQMSACLGNRFELETMAVISRQSPEDVVSGLWPALQEGMVIPENETYKFFKGSKAQRTNAHDVTVAYRFLHDRVQQAAYALIPEPQKQKTHYQIGQCLLKDISLANQEENLFDIVNQINLGRTLITQADETDQLISLNLRAGIKAKLATAYGAAVTYFDIALKKLPENSWQQNYSLALTLHENAVEAAYLAGDVTKMEAISQIVASQTNTPLDTVKTIQVKMQFFMGKNQPLVSIEIARNLLQYLGFTLPESPTLEDVQQELETVRKITAQFKLDEIIAFPALTDPNKLAIVSILILLISPTMITNPNLFLLIALAINKISLEYGNSSYSPYGYSTYAILLKNLDQNLDSSYDWGNLALKLLRNSETMVLGNRAYQSMGAFLIHSKRHVKETLAVLNYAYTDSLEQGDFEFAGYALMVKCYNLYFLGRELSEVKQAILKANEALSDLRQNLPLSWNQCCYDTVIKLSIAEEDFVPLIDDSLDDEAYVQSKQEQGDAFGLCYFYFNQAILLYTLGDYSQALAAAKLVKQYLASQAGMLTEAVFYFYDSLIHLACASEFSTPKVLAQVADNQQRMKCWAESAPMNFQHKYELVCAEEQRILGDRLAAMDYYDRAIAGAREQGYLQEEALANELAGKFYLDWGKKKFAAGYLQAAYLCYACWGAQTKIRQLVSSYAQLLEPVLQPQHQALSPLEMLDSMGGAASHSTHRGQQNLSQALDLASVIESAQLLASNLELENVIAQLMKLMLQSSGAETCALTLSETFQTQPAQNTNSQGEWLVHRLTMDELSLDAKTTDLEYRPKLSKPHFLPVCSQVPTALIQYVRRTGKSVKIDALEHEEFNITDAYLLEQRPQSVLVQPIHHQDTVVGVLYLENQTTAKVFNPNQRKVIDFFCNQAGIALENARLYQQQAHQARTLALKNQELQIARRCAEAASLAKSHFLRNVSHELRTPLNGILGYSQILRRSQSLSEQERQGVETIDQCGNKLLDLVNDVIALTQTETEMLELKCSEVHLPALLKSVLKTIESQVFSCHVQLGCQLSAALPKWVWVDGKRLQQVLLNLLENGNKFTEQGNIRLQVDVVTMTSTQASVKFQVIDTGIGIAETDQMNLFRLFEQVRNSQTRAGGLGMGLAMSQLIVQQMGGEITVESQLGRGSKFAFVLALPLCKKAPIQGLNIDDTTTNNGEGKTEQILSPSKEELQTLLRLAQTGRLIKMRQQLEELIRKDNRYAGFACSILALEKQFKLDEIEALLNQYLTSPVESS